MDLFNELSKIAAQLDNLGRKGFFGDEGQQVAQPKPNKRMYYVVIQDYERNGKWGIEFGSYDKKDAQAEAADMKQSGAKVQVVAVPGDDPRLRGGKGYFQVD